MPDIDDGSLGGMEGLSSLKQFEKMHRLDPNLPLDELDEVEIALNSANSEKGAEIEQILAEDNSPYPEVRPSGAILTPPRGPVSSRVINMAV